MNASKVLKYWEEFKDIFPKVDQQNRMMKLNFDFGLDNWFLKNDLDQMLDNINKALNAIREVDQETQR